MTLAQVIHVLMEQHAKLMEMVLFVYVFNIFQELLAKHVINYKL